MTNQTDHSRQGQDYYDDGDPLYQRDSWSAHRADYDDQYDQYGPATAPMEATSILTADERDLQREERNRRLGVRTRDYPQPDTADPRPPVRTTDKFHGSLALFLLRLITAAILGYHGWQHLVHMGGSGGTQEFFAHSVLPRPGLVAWAVTVAEISVAILLVLGLLVRLSGLAIVAIEVLMLVFFVWGKSSVFPAGQTTFRGETELLLAGIGLLLMLLGSGGVGVDAAFRRDRDQRRARKLAGDY